MRDPASLIAKSYLKTAVASLTLGLLIIFGTYLALRHVPSGFRSMAGALGVLLAMGAATFACASLVVLARHRRAATGRRDLFLELNQSKEPEAIKSAAAVQVSQLRRWLAKRLLGHELVVGDLVEIKSWDEIRATLDATSNLEKLPFMPEMLPMCGRRAHVFRCMHRLFDYRKTRLMRHMRGAVLLAGTVCDGSQHGHCEAACHTIWKSAWLKRVTVADATGGPGRNAISTLSTSTVPVAGGTAARHFCQLTQLHDASQPIGDWSPVNFFRPLVAGNVTLGAFAVGWLTHLFNRVQQLRGGSGFPAFDRTVKSNKGEADDEVKAGNQVVVKSSGEIRATLNDQMMHRGLWLEPDMLKHCGQRHRVQAEVRRLVDIVSGDMLTMKTPAFVLHDVHFSGERQLFNAQYEPLMWRGAWLRREDC